MDSAGGTRGGFGDLRFLLRTLYVRAGAATVDSRSAVVSDDLLAIQFAVFGRRESCGWKYSTKLAAAGVHASLDDATGDVTGLFRGEYGSLVLARRAVGRSGRGRFLVAVGACRNRRGIGDWSTVTHTVVGFTGDSVRFLAASADGMGCAASVREASS